MLALGFFDLLTILWLTLIFATTGNTPKYFEAERYTLLLIENLTISSLISESNSSNKSSTNAFEPDLY